MKDLLRIASLLDESGQFELSDKLFRIAQYQSNIDQIPIEMQVRRLQELRYLQRQDNQKIEEAKEKYNNKQISLQEYQNIYNQINNNQTSQEINKIKQSQMWRNLFPNDQVNNSNPVYPKNMPSNLSGTRVMDGSQYLNNPYTPKGIMDIRRQLVPTDFRGEMYQNQRNDTLIHTTDIKSFAIGLLDFARINRFPNLQVAFDNYANSGATFRGQNVQNVPALKELYLRISRTPSGITRQMIEEELRNIFRQQVGMSGAKFESDT